jgi:hypothetical protein
MECNFLVADGAVQGRVKHGERDPVPGCASDRRSDRGCYRDIPSEEEMDGFAIAMVDELERPAHSRRRFTVGC